MECSVLEASSLLKKKLECENLLKRTDGEMQMKLNEI